MGLIFRQRFITEFLDQTSQGHTMGRSQTTLTGDILPVSVVTNGRKIVDRNSRLFHFYYDPSPVLTVMRSRIIVSDRNHIKFKLPKMLFEMPRTGRVEVRHFGVIQEEHSYNIENSYMRVCVSSFYTRFYGSYDVAIIKVMEEKLYVLTKIGDHPYPYFLINPPGYRSTSVRRPVVITTKRYIMPLAFYEAVEKHFPSVLEITGKIRTVIDPGEVKQYISAPDTDE